jgi:hypothetical protein
MKTPHSQSLKFHNYFPFQVVPRNPSNSKALCNISQYASFTYREITSTPNPQATIPSLASCPQLLMQHIHSYPPYLEAIISICSLWAHHTLVTTDTLNMVFFNSGLWG